MSNLKTLCFSLTLSFRYRKRIWVSLVCWWTPWVISFTQLFHILFSSAQAVRGNKIKLNFSAVSCVYFSPSGFRSFLITVCFKRQHLKTLRPWRTRLIAWQPRATSRLSRVGKISRGKLELGQVAFCGPPRIDEGIIEHDGFALNKTISISNQLRDHARQSPGSKSRKSYELKHIDLTHHTVTALLPVSIVSLHLFHPFQSHISLLAPKMWPLYNGLVPL